MLDEGIVGRGADGDRLLDQTVEALTAVLRGTSIDANGESSREESKGSRRMAP